MAEPARFNPYILKAIDMIAQTRARLGYDINSYFTRNLNYGGTGTIPANHPPKTMCVAAVCEIIVEALNLWQQDHKDPQGQPDKTPFLQLPVRSWRGGSRADIRAHIFMYSGLNCRGTAHALARFGIGGETSFDQLQPGDFVNFNRSTTGHAAVFLGYIDKSYNDVPYSRNVAGFKYFSAQGKGRPDAGFGYRWGFFAGVCPPEPTGKVRDCSIRRSTNLSVLDVGYMADPSAWHVSSAIAELRADYAVELAVAHNMTKGGSMESLFAAPNVSDDALEALTDTLFDAPLNPPDMTRFDDSLEPVGR